VAAVLVIDDDKMICAFLCDLATRMGHQASFALTLGQGMDAVMTRRPDVVFLDVRLPDGNGLDALPAIRSSCADAPEVIIITGRGDPDGAELAIKSGAWDYIEKPAAANTITLPLMRALEYRKSKTAKKNSPTLDRNDIIGHSSALLSCLDQVAQAANSDVNVLITGETGTGKELLARAIHRNSKRKDAPFVVVDCTAIPGSIVESLLFGYEKGAFTGAEKSKTGLIQQANGGTLFLDEVGELPAAIQKTFLRILQERRFRPLGGREEIASNFRILAATNRNLENMAAADAFREDLFYRLQSFAIHSPPLRERPEDIVALTLHYAAEICEQSNMAPKGFSPDFFGILIAYHWPGNVRELFNTLHGALTASVDDAVLYPSCLPVNIRAWAARKMIRRENRASASQWVELDGFLRNGHQPSTFREYKTRLLWEGEKHYFAHLAAASGGNVAAACRMSGLSKSRLYYFYQKHAISPTGKDRPPAVKS